MTKNDCAIRALAAVTETPYADVVARLVQDGYRPGRGFHLDRWLTCQMAPAIGEPEKVFGWDATWIKLPPVQKGQRRPTLATFAALHPGRYILQQSRHVVALVDGRATTEERYDNAPIYGAWKFTRN
jgi:hypothetical protein